LSPVRKIRSETLRNESIRICETRLGKFLQVVFVAYLFLAAIQVTLIVEPAD
jgi:hypothetical protein